MKNLRLAMFVPALLLLLVTGTMAVQADHGDHGHHSSFLNSLAGNPSLTASTVPRKRGRESVRRSDSAQRLPIGGNYPLPRYPG